jgi:hypothetical protein
MIARKTICDLVFLKQHTELVAIVHTYTWLGKLVYESNTNKISIMVGIITTSKNSCLCKATYIHVGIFTLHDFHGVNLRVSFPLVHRPPNYVTSSLQQSDSVFSNYMTIIILAKKHLI